MSSIALQLFRLQNKSISLISPTRAVKRALQLFFKPRRHSPKSWEMSAEQEGTRHMLSDGCSAISWGTGDRQVLMIHGWEGRATQMSAFVPQLLAKGFKVIAVDAPGHGQSSGDISHPKRFVDALFAAAESFGPFEAVIGHSMGGGTALYAALEGLPVNKVISISGPSNFESVSRRFAQFIGLTASVTNRFVNGVETTVGIPFERINLAERAAELSIPALLVHDKEDQEVPFWHAQKIQFVLSSARLVTTKSLGHRRIVRDPYVVEQIAEFIADQV